MLFSDHNDSLLRWQHGAWPACVSERQCVMQEVLHALCDKNRKLPKRPSLSAPHGRTPPAELVTLMQQCWHQVITSLPPSAHLCTQSFTCCVT